MSATNLIVRGQKAYLMADAALYHGDGTVLAFQSKLLLLPRLRAALVFSGLVPTNARDVVRRHSDGLQDVDQIIGALPKYCSSIEEANRRAIADGYGVALPELIQVFLACYSLRRGRAEGYLCASSSEVLGAEYVPLTVRGCSQVISPPIVGFAVPEASFSPLRDGRAIMEAQRHVPHASGTFNVGGWGEIATVDCKGVTSQRLIEWQDEIGRRIAPGGTGLEGCTPV